jgi:uncharacterized protein YkwD/stress response protein SCP2
MIDLVSGGNLPLPDGALSLAVPGPFDFSVLVTGDDGKVAGDSDFVFYNQPSAPGIRLNGDTITVDPRRLRAGASRITVVVSPAESGTAFGRLPVPTLSVTGAGSVLARFTPARPAHETVLLLAEIYRRGGVWKLRALGLGYADGLAGVARDFGIEVADDSPAPASSPPVPAAAGDSFLSLVNAERTRAGVRRVTLDARLAAAAQSHATVMAGQGRLSTEGPDGTSVYQRVTAGGYAYLTIAEHLVSGPRTAAGFVDYCRTGEATRRPLHDPLLVDAGIGQAVDARSGDFFWTALWARPFSAEGLARTVSDVLALTNAERAASRLAPLAHDPRLAAAAHAHSADMVARGFYSHTTPEGLQPWDRARAAGSAHRGIGENIACGQRAAAEVVRGWMNSPGHRANILKPDFTHLGVGFVGGGQAGMYWTQLFGRS